MEAVEYMWPILKGSRPPQGICGKAAPACSVCSPLCILTAHAGCSALALPGSGRLLELFKQAIKLHRFKMGNLLWWWLLPNLQFPWKESSGFIKLVFVLQRHHARLISLSGWVEILNKNRVFPAMNKTDTRVDQTTGMWTHILSLDWMVQTRLNEPC